MKYLFHLVCCFFLVASCQQPLPEIDNSKADSIRINQVGYYPNAPKKAVIVEGDNTSKFQLIDLANNKSVFEGELSTLQKWDLAGETVQIADFSTFSVPGSYRLYVENLGYSHAFDINNNILDESARAVIKALYYQRASTDLPEKHAGKWHRKAGHPDNNVSFHPSTNKEGTMDGWGGWYDAGDFGKYVVNGSYPLGQMLTLHEQYPDFHKDNTLNIPESGNGNSDLLDELKYEMNWLLRMQDHDGGVFFKLTTKRFTGMILPEKATEERFIIGKSTTATLDFAAVAAKMAQAFKEIDSAYSNTCMSAAIKAYNWAKKNPEIAYKNPENVVTGEYGDSDFSQEFYWAAAELYLTTQQESYLEDIRSSKVDFSFKPGESWANHMHYIGAIALIDHLEDGPLKTKLETELVLAADELVELTEKTAYFQPLSDFQWGSNSDIFNTAMIVANAYRITKKPIYLKTVQEIADYVFGKNATAYSFVTGFGDKTPMFIHHRQSAGDEVLEPVPGFISGGPNSRKQDKNEVTYPNNEAPMKAWADDEASYASNEICLNWNSAAVYVLGFLANESN
ncbi:glycoside hydrolase family 9 protein [Spongiivirga citrea]|uniref:Endoglucanase n=1 Tax=Spongiivirga citrea TaxID=1481457 RepID=A0A6M0CMW9_9FLAO|nr:glycoside hydrolase family 9 protein [Spongiivirga citrea]NER19012.1 cellulase [Spongiivirga citrea]